MDKPMSPYEFLKSTRPDEFSDSTVVRKAKLNREFFDYYLNSITNRSQEKEFQLFCKRMAEYEICPNLLPQTGPTGGGDSKVDSETYPVSDDLALTWYSGIGRETASERWAFAISAKKDWRSKVKTDVENIISTNRDYKKIFFISNQYIPDKKRASIEDELSTLHGVSIKILDRSWLLDKLFNNHHEQIAVESFALSDSFINEKSIGPLDYERKQNLDKLETEIKQSIADGIKDVGLVESAIESAILSRELELPFDETMGRFMRASTLASKYGTIVQKKECSYQWAWTLYWWYQEFDEFYNKYCEYEKLVVGGINVFDLERLTNLWMNLFTITSGNPEEKNFKLHTETLISEYKRFIDDKNRPNAAIEAKANFVFVKLILGYDQKELLDELTEIINECDGVLDFSLDTISKMIMGIAPTIKESSNFDTLFETLVSVSSNRKQESVAAQMLLNRGKQLIDNKPYSAIRYLGRALLKLYKEESKKELLAALFLIGYACEKAALLWAARGFYLNAFFISLTDYMKYGNLNPILVGCSESIKMLELKMGRIPQTMEWFKLDNIVKGLLSSIGYDAEKLQKINNIELYDAILGMLFFRTPLDDLQKLTLMPDVLDRNGLHMAAIALKYALGHLDEEIQKVYNHDESAIDNFMSLWYNQPAKEQIPDAPILGLNNVEYLKSKILGCYIIVESDLKFPCIELSESILAAIESFLATGTIDKMMSFTPKVNIKVKYVPTAEFKICYQKEDVDGKPQFTISCSDFPQSDFREAQSITKGFILRFLAEIIPYIVVFKDAKEQLESMSKDDLVLHRALDFTGSIFVVADLFGKDAISINNWISSDEKEYPLKRSSSLEIKAVTEKADSEKGESYKIKRGLPDSEVFNPEAISHKDIDIISVINIPLWDKAKWKGMMFALSLDYRPPILAPVFTDINAGIAIFKEWISLVGKADEKDIIRVGLIKGINKNFPHHYKAIFTANTNVLLPSGKAKYISIPSRFRTMEAENNKNLTGFENVIKVINAEWKYYLVPAYINPNTKQPELLYNYSILKKTIEIKNCWEIGEDNWLAFAITPDDDPIIPPFVSEAPISKVMRRVKPFEKM
ncbi:MAG TPA: hypothetical protein PK566_16480 [Pseudobacteroides sp.]|nr:hypothetical protein [Pseudobacteroides sp.]